MNVLMKSVGNVGTMVALFGGSIGAQALESNFSVFEQPIQILCNVSTRVIAGDINVGINPLEGYLVYNVNKYHATNERENQHIEGSTLSNKHTHQSVTISQNLGTVVTIQANGFDESHPQNPTRLVHKKHFVEIVLKKSQQGSFELSSFKINGKDFNFKDRSVASCQIVQ